jgi:hypothetical protein
MHSVFGRAEGGLFADSAINVDAPIRRFATMIEYDQTPASRGEDKTSKEEVLGAL